MFHVDGLVFPGDIDTSTPVGDIAIMLGDRIESSDMLEHVAESIERIAILTRFIAKHNVCHSFYLKLAVETYAVP
jgi:hypothetical protein